MRPYLQTGHGKPCPVFQSAEVTRKLRQAGRITDSSRQAETRTFVVIENLKSLSDTELVKRMGSQADALACIYDRYSSLVYGIALRVLKEPTAAEDIANDVFLQLWKNPGGFDERKGKLPSWLTVITRNRAVDLLRKRRPDSDIPVEDVSPPKVASSSYFAADFEKARRIMDSLPPEQRRALELAYLDGLTQSEISVKLGEPLGTVKSRIRIGLGALKKALA